MTGHKKTSASNEESIPEVKASPTTDNASDKGKSRSGVALALVAIAISLAVGAGLYLHGQQQLQQQTTTVQKLTEQLNALQQQNASALQTLRTQLNDNSSTDAKSQQQTAMLAQQLDEVKRKLAALSANDANTWLLSQADYLVKLAGRKLWSDKDVTTAAALLKSADESLAQMHDPSLIDARRALTLDISHLAAVSQIDYDGIILKVNQLANNVDNLRLADNRDESAPMDADSGELSSSLREWRQNLVKSWHNFMDDFITIRRRDETAVPLLAPDQDIYLRENIRSRLLVAAQAIPRHQDETFKQSIDTVATWVRAWFDTNDAATKAFLAQLDDLSQQSIAMDVPDALSSQPVIDKLMQTRVRNLLAQPGVGQPQQGE
ncbi:MAG: Protein HemX [Candidatus Erwinia impunctatus]|nr:Protein HemX [Culicoides impunctatus]